jgi:tRNA A-37 threonylcarbamoyl transferase component Bud32
VVDAVLVSERVPGPTLWQADLDAMTVEERDNLFRRVGRILRRIDGYGLSHFDAKASNWIVREDSELGPGPVMIDPDGVRRRRWVALGIRRLLRSLREKRQYTPEDSYSLCRGYAPYARLDEEPPEDAEPMSAP